MYQFVIGAIAYGDPGMLSDLDVEDARMVTLATLGRGEKSKFLYEYDFGDSWEHELLVEKILPREEGKCYPLCLAGKRARPPEDCGGIWVYVDFLAAIRDPQHPEHEAECWNGAASSIQTSLLWMMSIRSSNVSHHLKWEKATIILRTTARPLWSP